MLSVAETRHPLGDQAIDHRADGGRAQCLRSFAGARKNKDGSRQQDRLANNRGTVIRQFRDPGLYAGGWASDALLSPRLER